MDDGTQTEVALEEVEKAMGKYRERKGKPRAKDSGDIVMKHRSDHSAYQDLSGCEDEAEAIHGVPCQRPMADTI